LGKALSGGFLPISAVLADSEIMDCIKPGDHGSTYGGNPLGSAVAIRALEIVEEEDMVNQAEKLGQIFRDGLNKINNPMLQIVRGKGLLNAIVIDESKTNGKTAMDLCLLMKEKGLLAKPTHQNIIRLAPPLVITEDQIQESLRIIKEAMEELPNSKPIKH